MSYREMYDNLATDKRKVEIKKEQLRKKAIQAFKKAQKFPAWEIYEYTIPAVNNKYVIFFYTESRIKANNPDCDSYCVVLDQGTPRFLTWGARGYKQAVDGDIIFIRQISVYTLHFFQRYKERFLKDSSLTIQETACRYFSRNTKEMPIEMNADINRKFEEYGDAGKQLFRVRDGICFTISNADVIISEDGDKNKDKIDSILIIYRTFMRESDMEETQRAAIDKEDKSKWVQFEKDMQKMTREGRTTFKLEP